MLDHLPFITSRIWTHERLLLIPFCHNHRQWSQVRKEARNQQSFLGADIHHFPGLSLLTGFMGYPHLLTLLAGIDAWRQKTLFWLGTAGSLTEEPLPDVSSVSDLIMTPELQQAWGRDQLGMKGISGFWSRSAVTVDLPHRETDTWLDQMRQAGMERVEMELYPLRLSYGRPFTALLVGSDRVGADPGAEAVSYKKLSDTFGEAFSILWEHIHET